MIARMWHGRVASNKALAYRAFLKERAIPDYQSVRGNVSVHILERLDGDVTHCITLAFWENMDVINQFAGEDLTRRNTTLKTELSCSNLSRRLCITRLLVAHSA